MKNNKKCNSYLYQAHRSIAILLYPLLLICCSKSPKAQVDNTNPLENHPKPLEVNNSITAHRGAYRAHGAPQNSLEGFQDAIDLRLHSIECDIQLTKDNKLVIYHDLTYNGLKVASSTFSELRGSGKLANGEDLPLFSDFVQKALEGKYTRIWIDVKAVPAEDGGDLSSTNACIAAMNIARELKGENFIAGFLIRTDFIMQRAMIAAKNEFNLAYQSSDEPKTYASRGYLWASQPYESFYPDNAEKLQKFKDLGIKVNVYELDNKENASWFIKQGVDMIQSNYPQMVLQVLDSLKNK